MFKLYYKLQLSDWFSEEQKQRIVCYLNGKVLYLTWNRTSLLCRGLYYYDNSICEYNCEYNSNYFPSEL